MYVCKEVENNTEWDKKASMSINADFLQSSAWDKVKRINGWQAKRLFIYDDGSEVVAGLQLLTKKVLKQQLNIGYTSRGPVIFNEGVDMKKVLGCIIKYAKTNNIDYLNLDCNLNAESNIGEQYLSEVLSQGFNKTNWIQRSNTGLVDIEDKKNIDDLKPSLSKRRRTTVNKLIRNDEFVFSVGDSAVDVEEYMKLHSETAKLKGFPARSLKYNQTILDEFQANKFGDCFVGFMKYKETNQIVSSGLFICWSDICTYYSGSSVLDRKLSESSSLLQLNAMLEASKRGYKIYDLGGAPENIEDEKDPFYSVWRFKSSLGGEPYLTHGNWEKAFSIKGQLFKNLKKLKNFS